MRVDNRVTEVGGMARIHAGVVVPSREGACLTCGRMFDCCCKEDEELGSSSVERIKETMGVEEPLTWQALSKLQEEVRR